MLRFFRQIRQRLLTENRFSKYLLYTVGEILLVVIGILIALQIDNWNELRNRQKFEHKILVELHATLIGDLGHQQNMIQINKSSREAISLLLASLESKKPFTDSLSYQFTRAHGRAHGLARAHSYENAKNHGLDFLQTDSLKELLTWTYEVNTDWLDELNDRNNLYENNVVVPLLTQLFDEVHITDIHGSINKSMKPRNPDSLMKNEEYLNVLRTSDYKRQEFLFFQERRLRRMLRLKDLLEEELARYDDLDDY